MPSHYVQHRICTVYLNKEMNELKLRNNKIWKDADSVNVIEEIDKNICDKTS